MPRRVVITGLGTVSALGNTAAALWEGLCAGRSAVKPITRLDATGFKCRLGGEVAGFAAKDFVPKHYRKATKVMARDIELAVGAAKEAAEDARIVTRGMLPEDADGPTTFPPSRMGCHIGAGLIAADSDELAAAFVTARDEARAGEIDLAAWGSRGMDNLTPLWLLKYLPNMLACHVTIIHGCEGPSNTITCAEASGLLSVGESARVIERNDADLCFSGSAESKINPMGMLRMEYAGRLTDTGAHTHGAAACHPFAPGGMASAGVVGEGGGILILEEESVARTRGANLYARVSGVGAGHSPMRPVAGDGAADEGFQAAVENALDDADLSPADIDAAVLLGTGVPTLDAGEALALRALLSARADALPIVTVGPNLGNTMAGNGGILAAVGALCVKHQKVPARLNNGSPTLPGAKGPAQDLPLRHVLVATSSLGGQNAALILSRI